MYRNKYDGQVDIYAFILPFRGHLKEDNQWVVLRQMIDWEMIDKEYRKHFDNKIRVLFFLDKIGRMSVV